MNDDLRDKVALVTGAGSGLGAATARVFGRESCKVACLDVNREGVERIASELREHDVESVALPCDVSDARAVFDSVGRVCEQFGRPDVVVNCAAIDYTLSMDEMSIEQWDQVIAVNLRGPFLVAKAALPTMREQGSGHIVNVASTAATRAWANAAAYHASKWGLVGFGRGRGVEGRPDNIRVTTILPGGMRTHFFDRFEAQGIPMPDPETLQDPRKRGRGDPLRRTNAPAVGGAGDDYHTPDGGTLAVRPSPVKQSADEGRGLRGTLPRSETRFHAAR